MKMKVHYLLWLMVALIASSCEFDNYDPPTTTLSGRIVYNGEPINVSYNDVKFQLWEPGWQLSIPIEVTVDQDGSYSALLFNGTYKLIIQSFQGPFRTITNQETDSDTIVVNLKGDKTLDIEVLPYYMVKNTQFSANGRNVTGNFSLQKVITDDNAKNIEKVVLYTSKTYFVDGRYSIIAKELNGDDIEDLNSISLNVDVPTMTPAQSYVFARIGVKIQGVEDMIFSPIQKVDL